MENEALKAETVKPTIQRKVHRRKIGSSSKERAAEKELMRLLADKGKAEEVINREESNKKSDHPLWPKTQIGKDYIMFDRAWELANKLTTKHKEFDVKVDLVRTDDELFSDENLRLGVTQRRYFISIQNPEMTEKFTDALIRYDHAKELHMADQIRLEKRAFLAKAHVVRSESSAQTLQDLLPTVSKVINEYKETNQGKNPPLRKIAEILNSQNVPSPGGAPKWYAPAVKRVMDTEKAGPQR